MLLRAALGAALIGLVAGLDTPAARAQTYGSDTNATAVSGWTKLMQKLGVGKSADSSSDINYTERSPLVVPPTRDLPPPAAGPPLAADWPQAPPAKRHEHAKQELVPPATPINNPNPPVKKAWYNPASWFSKEEYAAFPGEPARAHLTDPPVGYRTPSPNEPYGIGPDKKGTKAAARDFNMTPVTPPSTSGK